MRRWLRAPWLNALPRPLPAAIAGLALLLAGGLIDPAPRLVWNLSSSAPRGLYLVIPGGVPRIGEDAAARLPAELEQLAAQRRYLPKGLPLIKKVAAVQGDEVCGLGEKVTVNARPAAKRLAADPTGRALPWWEGCRRLGAGELLLLNPARLSFDGRYAGPTDPDLLVGRARLIWAR